MKSNLEKKLCELREATEVLVRAEHGDGAKEILCSFAEFDCIADVRLETGWLRYELVQNGDDEENELRRIG